jgi:uncharacterized protein (DUF4415 family)
MKIPKLSDVKVDVEETRRIREMMKKTKKRKITINLDNDLVLSLKYLADQSGGKYQTLLNYLVREALEQHQSYGKEIQKLKKEIQKLKQNRAA